jgi:hypothetical protein
MPIADRSCMHRSLCSLECTLLHGYAIRRMQASEHRRESFDDYRVKSAGAPARLCADSARSLEARTLREALVYLTFPAASDRTE